MNTASCYRALLENNVTHTVSEDGTLVLKPCRVERKNLNIDWEKVWSLATTPGLSSEQSSFIWKMVHDLLPTRERLYRLNMQDTENPSCDLCTLAVTDDLEHALLLCPYNAASSYTLRLIQNFIPSVQPSQAVLLDLDIPPDLQLPVTFILSFCLSRIWRYRSLKKQGNPRGIRAELEAEIQILRKSRFHGAADKTLAALSTVDL